MQVRNDNDKDEERHPQHNCIFDEAFVNLIETGSSTLTAKT